MKQIIAIIAHIIMYGIVITAISAVVTVAKAEESADKFSTCMEAGVEAGIAWTDKQNGKKMDIPIPSDSRMFRILIEAVIIGARQSTHEKAVSEGFKSCINNQVWSVK